MNVIHNPLERLVDNAPPVVYIAMFQKTTTLADGTKDTYVFYKGPYETRRSARSVRNREVREMAIDNDYRALTNTPPIELVAKVFSTTAQWIEVPDK